MSDPMALLEELRVEVDNIPIVHAYMSLVLHGAMPEREALIGCVKMLSAEHVRLMKDLVASMSRERVIHWPAPAPAGTEETT